MINTETIYTLEKSKLSLTVSEGTSNSNTIITGRMENGMINGGTLNEYIDTLITELQELRESIT